MIEEQEQRTKHLKNLNTVKSFILCAQHFMHWWWWTCLWTLEFVNFQIICTTIKLNQFFVGILNLWIVLSTKYTKLNVQQILMISQYTRDSPGILELKTIGYVGRGPKELITVMSSAWLGCWRRKPCRALQSTAATSARLSNTFCINPQWDPAIEMIYRHSVSTYSEILQ